MSDTLDLFLCVRDGEILPVRGDLTALKKLLAVEDDDWGPDEDDAVEAFFGPPLPCVCDLDDVAGSDGPDFGQIVALDLLSVLPYDLAKCLKSALDTPARSC